MQTNFTKKQLQDSNITSADGILRKCVHCGFCNATCDFDPTSTVTLTERILQPESFQVNLQLCKSDFRADFDAIQMGYSAFDVLPKSFADFLIAHAAEKVAAGMETSIWRGVNATAGQFAGIMTQLTTDAALPAAQEIAGTTVDATNVIAQLGSIVDALPAALYGKEDFLTTVDENIKVLSLKIKESFDPKKILNPGKMYSGI